MPASSQKDEELKGRVDEHHSARAKCGATKVKEASQPSLVGSMLFISL